MNAPLDLSTSSLLDIIQPQPDDPREFLILVAYILSSSDHSVTVYPDLNLRSYLEIPRNEIIWAEKAVPGVLSSPTRMVINARAQIKRVTTAGRTTEIGFLSGMITATSLQKSAAGVTVNVAVENEPVLKFPPCPELVGPQGAGKTVGPTSTLKATGQCIDDGHPLDR